ncbi:benzoate/H(+) symporter BenE family transporter [Micromonospora sp. WMMD1082]|uniref:benzoate/H(+) symporter BenE family transporter n=1 Tax=Micromonospora sp. WMMD1082 TaxID=3016104 RepID=UPI0024178423|nr:benzoate/H(+) symporter BenE family transporter [Micromonospora sp. WMMD1082]MDG4797712.1 benzoate/H(+) symporter BenE family transporter [Micromonospora sp. WMMD1082]
MEGVRPVVAGLLSAVVGYASSFTLVLAGLQAVGASPAQAASGLLVTCLGIGVAGAVLTLRHRMPVAVAWSTPGAALLVGAGPVAGGFPSAVGAFLVCAALTVVAGLVPWLARVIAAIPRPVAGAMLAGILVPLCTAPVQALVDIPVLAVPVIVTWAVLLRYARGWAVPGALVAAVAASAVTGPDAGLADATLRPVLAWTAPAFDLGAVVGIALPLFLVTMAGQNVPGAAVLSSYGYQPPLRPALVTTGLVSAAGAPFGGHQVNLAAITAALTAGPEAHPDPRRRWIATLALAGGQVLLGLGAGAATALVLLSPPVLVIAVAGLALLPALGSALGNAVADAAMLLPAVVTFVVTASGVAVLGVGAAFWGLLAGLATMLVTRQRRSRVTGSRALPPA